MYSINLIGSGNIGKLFGMLLTRCGCRILSVYSQNPEHAAELANRINSSVITDLSQLPTSADLTILAIRDEAIEAIAAQLAPEMTRIHTSGTTAMSVLGSWPVKTGVLYPLQSISGDQIPEPGEIPLLLEANDEFVMDMLVNIAKAFKAPYRTLSSADRKVMHLSAVFINNFGNHMAAIGQKIAEDRKMDVDLFKPLISETARKLQHLDPFNAQTGPARRNDQQTMQQHLEMLKDYPDYRKLYELISQSIREMYD